MKAVRLHGIADLRYEDIEAPGEAGSLKTLVRP
ncbi:hypothetical protein HNP71_000468 [Acidocella aromatica]|uniref:Uncharacterized protein n=1 Tax=Acidocella aromatica TaxID=1303579 RepID=A0A840V9Q2_9PROT|nr:hypothetical protein [Acidocella aromatica]